MLRCSHAPLFGRPAARPTGQTPFRPLSWAALGLLALSTTAPAATFIVTRTDDPKPIACTEHSCSLREAVNAANATPGPHYIVLVAATYTLTRVDASPDTPKADRGALWVRRDIEILGDGPKHTRIRWNAGRHGNAVLRVEHEARDPVRLNLSHLSISHGQGFHGGCIHMRRSDPVHHELRLDKASISNCVGYNGGAAYLSNTDLVLIDSEIMDNKSQYSGGALQLNGPIQIHSFSSLLTRNRAGSHGGAVTVFGSPFGGWPSHVVWRDDGRSRLSRNNAAGSGGAIAVVGASSLNLATGPDAQGDEMLEIRGNQAASGGAIHLSFGLHDPTLGTQLSRVRLLENRAEQGGAITSQIGLRMSDSEVARNVATAGNGGAIAFQGDIDTEFGRLLERVSLHRNAAAIGGGAIYSECSRFTARDVSMHLNQAALGRGQAIDSRGPATLRHVSLHGNTRQPTIDFPGLLKLPSPHCPGGEIRYANSLIGDSCGMFNSGLVSEGGNQLGPDASDCPALDGLDQRQADASAFELGFDNWGGPFEVIGWSHTAVDLPQRDFGLLTHCTGLDVRGFPRDDGLCDAGAFEQQDMP